MDKHRREDSHRTARSGSVLIEFAFIALAFYLLFAGTIELGRMITTAQAVQNAARVGARELALIALPPTATFREALADPQVKARIYDENLLAVPVGAGVVPDTDDWPIINRMLTPLMLLERVGGSLYYHFPGAIVQAEGGGLTVRVPRLVSEESGDRIEWLPVVEEVLPSNGDGPFSLASSGPERGLVALRINCPYQATTIIAFKQGPGGQSPVLAGADLPSNDPGGTLVNSSSDTGAYGGSQGLGKLYALGQEVRPFRRTISAQSLFRREVYR